MHVLAGYAQRRESSVDRRVLILDPEVASRNQVAAILAEAGYPSDSCASQEAAFEMLAKRQHGALVSRQYQSLSDGLALTRKVQHTHAHVNVILLTPDPSLEGAVTALQAGVFDFMTKSFEPSALKEHLLDALRRTSDSERSSASTAPPSAAAPVRDPVRDVLVGESPLIERARQLLREALNQRAPVLISGEVGTEKQAVARLLHDASGRRERPFVLVNTAQASLQRSLEDEVAAGTLFYADASALDADWQIELVKRLSDFGATPDEAAPRIIAGLSQPPPSTWESSVLARLFGSVETRQVLLPPLRQRGRDVVILAEHFAEQVRLARGDASLRLTGTALEALTRYAWPGNVDELRFAVQHAASLCLDSMIRVADLPPGIGLSLTGATDESGTHLQVQSLEDMEFSYILRVLDAVGGNKASAARLLGVDRTTLYRKLQRQEQSGPQSSEAPPVRRLRK